MAEPPLDPLFLAVYALLLLERGFELVLDHDHRRILRNRGAVFHPHDGFVALAAVQALFLLGWAVEIWNAPWARTGPWTWPCLGVALLAQGLRYWCIASLGPRWTVRVATLPGLPPVRKGPYRFLRHPNYAAVLVETAVLPLAFGAIVTALAATGLQAAALAYRIRVENRALASASR